jgi:GTP-binding protein
MCEKELTMETTYITSAAKAEQLPAYELPEIAFFGRSNVGKSSLLNALLNRKNLAKHSATPGRTQMVNFFGLGKKLIFADLPGYGFSAIKKDVRKEWQPLITEYVKRPNIKEFLFLLDCRRMPNEEDLDLMYHLGRQLPLLVVLTKADKISRGKRKAHEQKVKSFLQKNEIEVKEVVSVSNINKKEGIEALREIILNHAADS